MPNSEQLCNTSNLRCKIRTQRSTLDTATQFSLSQKIVQTISNLPVFINCQSIASYIAINGEANPKLLIDIAWTKQKKCYLPILPKDSKHELIFANYSPLSTLIENSYHIPEPTYSDTTIIAAQDLDLVITPLVAFDQNCHRIGMGGGFYDRTFSFKLRQNAKKPFLLGIAYELQKLPKIDPNPWDIQLDCVVTESNIYTSA